MKADIPITLTRSQVDFLIGMLSDAVKGLLSELPKEDTHEATLAAWRKKNRTWWDGPPESRDSWSGQDRLCGVQQAQIMKRLLAARSVSTKGARLVNKKTTDARLEKRKATTP